MSSERSNHTTRPLHHQTQRANIQQIVCERERGRGGCCIKLLFFSPQSLFVLMSLCLFDLCHLSLSFSMSLTQLGWLSIVGTVSIFLFRSLSPFPSSLSPFYHLSLPPPSLPLSLYLYFLCLHLCFFFFSFLYLPPSLILSSLPCFYSFSPSSPSLPSYLFHPIFFSLSSRPFGGSNHSSPFSPFKVTLSVIVVLINHTTH